MHLFITLSSQPGLELPIHYNHILQGVVYSAIDPRLAGFLHDEGYVSGNRNFKLFTMSRLMGKWDMNQINKLIRFGGDIRLVISSPVIEFCQSLANTLLINGQVFFGTAAVPVREIAVKQLTVKGEKAILRTLSPIVVYSTMIRADGRKYTCYFQPGEPEYDQMVENNLRKKYQALYGSEAPAGEVRVKNLGQLKMNIINYKNTIIKGYSGRIVLTGPQALLQMAVDAGVGSKNSQGFGCVEMGGIVRRRTESALSAR